MSVNPEFNKILSKALEEQKKKTNADRIRSMTDEELAELISHRVICGDCIAYEKCHLRSTPTECEQLWLDWLQSPADEVEMPTKCSL